MSLKTNLKFGSFGTMLINFAGSQILSNFLRLASGFIIIRSLSPEDYGLFTGVGIYLSYILLSHLGIINGLSRELPFEFGRKNDSYGRELASSAFSLTLFLSIIASSLFLVGSIIKFFEGDYILGAILSCYTITSGFHMLNKQFLPVLYRTNKDFKALSVQNIIFGFINLLSVVFVYFWHLEGLIIRAVLLSIVEFYLLFRNRPYKLFLTIKYQHLKKLLKTGVPIFLVGNVNLIWLTLINNFIFLTGGARYFGLFSLSVLVQSTTGIIPSAFSQIIYPRMGIMFGQGKSVKTIVRANIKPLLFQFVVMFAISITGVLTLPLIIPIILPSYIDGIAAAQWMFLVPLLQSFGALANIYNVIKKQKFYFISLCSGAIVGSLIIYLLYLKNGFILEVFPQGIACGMAVQQVLSLFFINRLSRD